MRTPFPGMDPYLEQPESWQGFHNSLIAAVALDLAPRLRPRYYVATEERTYLVRAGPLNLHRASRRERDRSGASGAERDMACRAGGRRRAGRTADPGSRARSLLGDSPGRQRRSHHGVGDSLTHEQAPRRRTQAIRAEALDHLRHADQPGRDRSIARRGTHDADVGERPRQPLPHSRQPGAPATQRRPLLVQRYASPSPTFRSRCNRTTRSRLSS